jgi:tetratricopeptide (TPR) repeat protein
MLYLSQYVTNEGMAAGLVTASLYLALRILRFQPGTWKPYAALGLVLGAAILTKVTAVLAVPAITGALVYKGLQDGCAVQALKRAGAVLGMCVLTAGWHYVGKWFQYGTPFIANWNPASGFAGWSQDGYQTGQYYLRFGQVLKVPWYAAFHGFADGLYSTLWGDGDLSGAAWLWERPPWNYESMAAGYWLALLPTLAALLGMVIAVRRFLRKPSPQWLMLLTLAFSIVFALAFMSLVVPDFGQVKAQYGLCGLVPLSAFAALGLEKLRELIRPAGLVIASLLGTWALCSFNSFRIPPGSSETTLCQAVSLSSAGQTKDACEVFNRLLRKDPHNAQACGLLIPMLLATGQKSEAIKQSDILLRDDPPNTTAQLALATMLEQQGRESEALARIRRACELTPGYAPAFGRLALLLIKQGAYADAEQASRKGLALNPFDAELRLGLGLAYLMTARDADATPQLWLGFKLEPNLAIGHILLARCWTKLGRLEDAATEYSQAIALDAANAELHQQLAAVLVTLGRPQEATNHLEEAQRLSAQTRD